KDGTVVENVDDLAGLSTTNPFMAVVLTALMFSLAGIPPLAGFFAKYFVFVAAIEAKLYALSIIGVLASVAGRLIEPHQLDDTQIIVGADD
ncbi:proton-conducting transporter transmembrane domain-containing protein, partial [Rhizobium leguminosarum]|uniref:proton-conducting transporter transmembrane domain-containing protein n=1 Tax=Rhizobium leguminosarum TaxID=384 RepID=UPI003F97C595